MSAYTTGLENKANTCYINSIVQCLMHTDGLLLALDDPHLIDMCNEQKETLKFLHELKNLVAALSTGLPKKANVGIKRLNAIFYREKDFKNQTIFIRNQQNDAGEFLNYLLQWLRTPILNVAILIRNSTIQPTYIRTRAMCQAVLECDNCFKRQFLIFTN